MGYRHSVRRAHERVRANRLGVDRREFLTATGTGLLAASLPNVATGVTSSGSGALPNSAMRSAAQASAGSLRKIPIGVFDPVYEKLSLDEMLDRVSALALRPWR